MRGSRAKHIRSLVRKANTAAVETTYTEVKHPSYRAPTGQLAADGTQLFVTITPVQRVLFQACQRHLSQYVKRAYNKR